MTAAVAQADIGGIAHQVFVVAYHFLLDAAEVDPFHSGGRVAMSFYRYLFQFGLCGSGFGCGVVRGENGIAEDAADKGGKGEYV